MAKAKKQMNNKKAKAMAMARPRPRPRRRQRKVDRKSETPSNLFLEKKMKNDMTEEIQMEAKPTVSNPDPDAVYSRSATPCRILDDDCDFFHFPEDGKYEYEPTASSPSSTPSNLFLKKKMKNDMAEEIQMEAKPTAWNPDPGAVYSRSATPCRILDDDCNFFHFPEDGKYVYEPAASSPLSTPSNMFLKKKMNDMADEIQMEAKPIASNPDPDAVYSRSATPCCILDDDCDFFNFPEDGEYEYEPTDSSPPSTPCHLDSPASTRVSRRSMTPSLPPPGFPEPLYYKHPAPIFYTTTTTPLPSSSPDSATSPFYYDCPPSPPPGFGFRSHYTGLQQQEYWDSDSDSESVGSSFSPCHRANLGAV